MPRWLSVRLLEVPPRPRRGRPRTEVAVGDGHRPVLVGVVEVAWHAGVDGQPARVVVEPVPDPVAGTLEVAPDRAGGAAARRAGVEHTDQAHAVGQRAEGGLVEPVGVGVAAVGPDPARDRLLGGPADGDHQPHVAVHHRLVEDAVAVLGDRRAPVLGQRAHGVRVLPEDRVDEGVQEQVGAVKADVAQEVLHAGAGPTGEGAVRQRLVLGALLADHHDLGGAVQPAAEEHRAVLPAEHLPPQHRTAEPPIVRRLGEQVHPAARDGRARVVLPWVTALVGHAASPLARRVGPEGRAGQEAISLASGGGRPRSTARTPAPGPRSGA